MARSTRQEKKSQQKPVKKVKFEILCGWSHDSTNDNGFQAWMQRKLDSIELKQKKPINKWQPFLCTPRQRCVSLENLIQYEDDSLIPSLRPNNFVPRTKEAQDTDKSDEHDVQDKGFTANDASQEDNANKEKDQNHTKHIGTNENVSLPLTRDISSDSVSESTCDALEKNYSGAKPSGGIVQDIPEGKDSLAQSERKNGKSYVKSVTSLGFTKHQKDHPKNGLFNSVESIGRLLKSNPVRLSYTRSNFNLYQKEHSWLNPALNKTDHKAGDSGASLTKYTMNNTVKEDTVDFNVQSQGINQNSNEQRLHNKSVINNVLNPNGYRTFDQFERAHTMEQYNTTGNQFVQHNGDITIHKHSKTDKKSQTSPKDSRPVSRSFPTEAERMNSFKFNQMKPSPIAPNIVSIRDSSDPGSNGASHQVAANATLVSSLKESVHTLDRDVIPGHPISQIQSSRSPHLVSHFESKGVENLFPIGDIIPYVNKNINNGRTIKNEDLIKIVVQNNYKTGIEGNDLSQEGTNLQQIQERNQNFLGPPAFRPQANKTHLQRARDITSKRVQGHTNVSTSQAERDSQVVHWSQSGRSRSVPTAPSMRRCQPNGKLPPIMSNASMTGHLTTGEVTSHTARI